ncbi:hypothetical protein F5Y14DRAFT_445960 [Nemania sp. NC0429]|nr:hypothetical protein F5Y14DRAFT_445960 [Nemania sp. NC0429]
MALVLDASTATALSGVVAATSANAGRAKGVYYRSPRTSLDSASYMNYLRAPAPPRAPSSRGGVGGVHIHYQGQCPHGPFHPGDHHRRAFHSDGDGDGDGHSNGYGDGFGHAHPLDPRAPRYSYYAGLPNSPCGCSQCYWRDFLTNDMEKYKTKRKQLRETYVWNLHELYYVGRVREVYDNHCRHHRLLFRDVCLTWEMPEKAILSEEAVTPAPTRPATLHSHRSRSGGLGASISLPPSPAPPPKGEGAAALQTVGAGRIDKGKGKEVLPVAGGEVSGPIRNVDGEREKREEQEHEQEEEEKEEAKAQDKDEEGTTALLTPTASDTIIPKPPQAKHSKISMQQRIRQFWPARARGRSLDKTDPVQEGATDDGTKQEGGKQESAA